MHFIHWTIFTIGLLGSPICFSDETPTLGSIAEMLTEGTGVITRFVVAVCFALGIGLMIVSIHMYRQHRHNPKFVPLDRVVMYLVLGVLVLGIPFLGKIFGPTGSYLELDKHKPPCASNIDTPLELGNEFDH